MPSPGPVHPADARRWAQERGTWPHTEHSRFVEAAGLCWHLQQMGHGPDLLLLHGTGSSTHTWRALMPTLAARWRVTAVDLPGHGFSAMPRAPDVATTMSLDGMARALRLLLQAVAVAPVAVVGHSAGAAVAVRLALDERAGPLQACRQLVSLNGALMPWQGVPALVFAPLARVMASSPWPARWFAHRMASEGAVRRLIAQTGSRIDPEGEALYARLVARPEHTAAALAMMARWQLPALARALPRLTVPLLLLVGERDLAVPPTVARQVCARLPAAHCVQLAGLGHLAHEEQPERLAGLIAHALAPLNPPS